MMDKVTNSDDDCAVVVEDANTSIEQIVAFLAGQRTSYAQFDMTRLDDCSDEDKASIMAKQAIVTESIEFKNYAFDKTFWEEL